MLKDTITTLALAAGPLLLAWIGALVRRYIAQRLYVAQTRVLERRARAVTAESQSSVDDLKDPAQPGEWSSVMAARTRAEAINRVRALEPLACQTVLEALDGDAQKLDGLIGTYVEESVRAMRQWETAPVVDAHASALANERALPRPEVPAPINPQAGHIRASLLGVVLLVASALLTTRCTASAVETQATALDQVATVLNRAAPVALDEADHAAQSAALAEARACVASMDAGVDCRARAHEVYDAQRAAWRRVFVAWDALGETHSAAREVVLRCRALDAGTCTPNTETLASVVRALGAWRCAVRAVGRADLDPLPGAPSCADGGLL